MPAIGAECISWAGVRRVLHSSLDHLFKLCDIAADYGLGDRTSCTASMDGRDTDPRSGKDTSKRSKDHVGYGGPLARVGRYYALTATTLTA